MSWPNPTAEKILSFNHHETKESDNQQEDDEVLNNDQTEIKSYKSSECVEKNITNTEPVIGLGGYSAFNTDSNTFHHNSEYKAKEQLNEKNSLETYNLTHDSSNGYTLKFDDVNWNKNLNSLKPLVIIVI